MGAPDSGMKAADQGSAESLLTAFRTIKAEERARHEQVLDYWLSIRGNKEFPPLHDLDPLEISDAGPSSILLELIGGGQDAEVRHLGDDLKADISVDRIIDAPSPSILACIAKKLPIVAISREFLAFEDSYDTAGGWTRCWITLLPLSSCGSWVDYVYAFVSIEKSGGKPAEAPAADVPEAAEEVVEPVAVELEEPEAVAEETVGTAEPVETEAAAEEAAALEQLVEEAVAEEAPTEEMANPSPQAETAEAIETPEPEPEVAAQPFEAPPFEAQPFEAQAFEAQAFEEETDPEPASRTRSAPGFAKLIEGFANLTGFYGQSVNIDPSVPVDVPVEEAPVEEPQAVEDAALDAEHIEPEAEALELDEPADEQPIEQAVDEIAADEPIAEPITDSTPEAVIEEPAPEPDAVDAAPVMEGSLQSKLTEVQAKADEAREAQLRATQALHQGLSAAYDFALDAENSPEEYLRLVEAQGMKIQLRAPMAPVAKLAFDGVCDAATIRQFEAVLAWALKVELPRGTLLERIDQAGGISELLSEFSKAA